MKSIYTLVFALLIFTLSTSAQVTHTIINNGFTYSPDSLVVNVGDQVTFSMDFTTHPLHEVSSATWSANGSTQLASGFSATSGTTMTVTMNAPGTRYYVCSNHVSFGMKGRIFTFGVTGIQAISSVAATTYPNPAHNLLYIVAGTTGDFHYSLSNMLGQTVVEKSEPLSGQGIITVDISDLREGTYILSSRGGDGVVHTSKVQIVR